MDTLKNMYTVVKSYSVDPICDFFASHYVDKTQIAFSVVVGIVVYNIVVGYLDAKDAAKKDKEANSESEIPSNSSSECKVEVSSECKVEVEVLPIPSSGVELESVSSKIGEVYKTDFALRGQISFQDAATSIMQGIINLHHHIFFFIIIVLCFVSYVMFRTYKISVWKFIIDKKDFGDLVYRVTKNFKLNFSNVSDAEFDLFYFYSLKKSFIAKLKLFFNLNVNHGTVLEIIWTIIPSLVLLFIVGPSFALLFAMDAIADPDYSIKIVGHQWYWSYEYTDTYVFDNFLKELTLNNFNNMSFVNFFDVFMSIYNEYIIDYSFDSYMKATADLSIGELRLLEVDLPLYLPIASKVRLDITSDDVMHAFAVPSLGIKLDAIPGRLNVIYVDILREGVFFGQCSELCGVNHGFMPIKIIAINVKDFVQFTFLSGIENMDTEVVLSSNSNLSDIFNKLAVNDTYFSNSLAQQKTLATSIAIELARGGNTDIILHIIATNGTFSDLEVMSSESI